MIKELLTGALTTLLLSAEPSCVLAAHPAQMQNYMCNISYTICGITQTACSYVDADGDGICDNYGPQTGGGYGNGSAASGSNFTDADGDGICDNFGSQAGGGYGNGSGGGYGNGYGGCNRYSGGHCGYRGGHGR